VVPGQHGEITGTDKIDRVICVDQSPLGKTPRSNPATYTGVFSFIRELFSQVTDSKIRGYTPSRFSFNLSGGRCELCGGDGLIKVEMHFLPPVYIPCNSCKGKRYSKETLEIRYKDKNIAEILDMTVSEALHFFSSIPYIRQKLKVLEDVGLGYLQLGQPASTLSGGEAQRVKLSKELGRKSTGNALYILDEPTTGLHYVDIKKLLDVINKLIDLGNTVIIIEHNLDVIKSADYIIDLGPEGGEKGGRVVAEGSPEEVCMNPDSYTGQFLRQKLLRLSDMRVA
jgi:excinuclease ABC subunit A